MSVYKYQIIKGSTFGELHSRQVFVGYDAETGEEEFEEEYYVGHTPNESVIYKFTDYDTAKEQYMNLIDEFERNHSWPWDDPHFEIDSGNYTTTFTNGEDSYWFILKQV